MRIRFHLKSIINRKHIGAFFFLFLILSLCAQGSAETVSFGEITAKIDTEYVDMESEVITDWDGFYAFLRQLPNLKKVDLFATEVRVDRIEDLTGTFPRIEFGMTMRIHEHTLRTDAKVFSTLHTSSDYPHGDRDLSLVRFCPGLLALDLGHNRLTDLSFLESLPELRLLIVAMNNLTDVSPIGELKHLEYLELFNNRITDISCLAGLPYLMDLNLVGNSIADFQPVLEIKSLKRLWMRDFRYWAYRAEIQEAANAARQALPDCEVNDRNGAIEGNWRNHPHYDVIHRVFTTGIYEPFEDSPEENQPAD